MSDLTATAHGDLSESNWLKNYQNKQNPALLFKILHKIVFEHSDKKLIKNLLAQNEQQKAIASE